MVNRSAKGTGHRRAQSRSEREQEFAHNASHELRTPLTVIRVASDLIAQDDGLSEASRRSLSRIHLAVDDMEALVDALLLLARCEQAPLEHEAFNVRTLLENELDRVRPLLRHKGVGLQLDVAGDPCLHGPPRALQVMIGNLLANAVHFSDAGVVRVRLQESCLQVEDTGVGMDPVTLARACDPFYSSVEQPPGGPGLGLAIARRLGVRCGWPLALASTQGYGTCASIAFPARKQD